MSKGKFCWTESHSARTQYRNALLTMDGSGLPSDWKLVTSPGGSSASLVDSGDGTVMATVQVMPNGTQRFSARADCWDMLPMTDINHDWKVVQKPGLSGDYALQSLKVGSEDKEIAIDGDAIVAFTTGMINLNPVDGNGKAYPLNKKGKDTKAPPQEGNKPGKGKGEKGEGEAAGEGQGEAKEGEGKEKKEATAGDLQAQAQGGGDGGDGDSDGDGDGGEPPPVEDDKLPAEEEEKEGKGGGGPPPPPPDWQQGEAVLVSTEGTVDLKTGNQGAQDSVPCTVLQVNPQQSVFQRWDTGRYIMGKNAKFKVKQNPNVQWQEEQENKTGAEHPVNIKNCPAGWRFIAVGESIPDEVFVSAPLGGSKDELGVAGRAWHGRDKDDNSLLKKVVKPNFSSRGVLPFSYYIMPLREFDRLKPKDEFEINGWKFAVAEWAPVEKPLARAEVAVT